MTKEFYTLAAVRPHSLSMMKTAMYGRSLSGMTCRVGHVISGQLELEVVPAFLKLYLMTAASVLKVTYERQRRLRRQDSGILVLVNVGGQEDAGHRRPECLCFIPSLFVANKQS